MAQKIQLPLGLHTDWLVTGHANEIVSFLPTDNDKDFQVLVASPMSARIILKGLADKGLVNAIMFSGVERADYKDLPGTYRKAEISIGNLLQDRDFWNANQTYQRYMNNNIQRLRDEIELEDKHIANVPVLFHSPLKSGRTTTYFPNMINYHLAKDGKLIVPQPKGPIVNRQCAFETALLRAVCSHKVVFTEDDNSRHKQRGKISLWA